MKKKKKLSLPVQIFIALVLGIVVGLVFYFTGAAGFTTSYIKPFGDIFVNLLKFIVVPVVLLSMIDGIISMGDMKKVGAVGWKTILYFMVTTAVACVIGLVLATVFNNAGLFPNLSEAAQAAEYEAKEYAGFMATLVAIFPTNMWKAARSGIRPPAPTSWIPSSASSPVTSGSPSAPPICFRSSSLPCCSAAPFWLPARSPSWSGTW